MTIPNCRDPHPNIMVPSAALLRLGRAVNVTLLRQHPITMNTYDHLLSISITGYIDSVEN